jgi:hypothetical protein
MTTHTSRRAVLAGAITMPIAGAVPAEPPLVEDLLALAAVESDDGRAAS